MPSAASPRTFLFVMRKTPWPGLPGREALDMVMTASAFDQAVSLLFLDDGVWQLKSGQSGAMERGLAPVLEALDLYDIAHVWVELESLMERGLEDADLLRSVERVARADVAALIQAQDCVVSC